MANLNADRLDGRDSSAFLPKATYRNFQGTTGTDLPGGGTLANMNCDKGDLILSGGYASVDAGTTIVSSQPYDIQGWELVCINDGTADPVIVTVLYADFGTPHTP